jgi:hypothetical protein
MDTARRVAQVVLVVVSALTAVTAAVLYLGRGPEALFGERIVAVPPQGPVGMRPFLEPRGFSPAGKSVYLCPSATGSVRDCVPFGSVRGSVRSQAKTIPTMWPNGDEIVPAHYDLRAGPDDKGQYPVRGTFEVVAFKVGPHPIVRTYAGVTPQALRLGTPTELARGNLVCAPPTFMPDGRLAVGGTVYDPTTGVTIAMSLGDRVSEMTWSPLGNKLAFITADHKEIRIGGPDGRDAVTKVREARGLLSSISWGPAGDKLAFIARDDPSVVEGGGPGPPTVNILNVATGSRTQAGPGLAVAWAPRGDVFVVDRASGEIELANPTGGRRSLVRGRLASFSPDGRFVAYVRDLEAGAAGFVALADGSSEASVTGAGVCGISFSASGNAVALVTGSGSSRRLVMRPIS